jgi:hypothetical protein
MRTKPRVSPTPVVNHSSLRSGHPSTTGTLLVLRPRHKARARPPTHAGKRISTSYGDDSWWPCRRHALIGALNANLTSHATITSPSTSTLPHAKLSPRHSSTLYDVRGPRLRLTRGKTSKYSGKLKRVQTTRGEGQASRKEQFNPSHAAASPTRYRNSAPIRPDGQRRTKGRISCQVL